ncbi:MAG TPA: TMEM165/GDT1 family protein [Candidatus Acidoferrum sp.]|nr:TMEM165/GDT1 family protein [Candidatus Acidoferrum sp.]
MNAFLASLAFVSLAEMGDKTQLLAMAFATRYSAGAVLRAIFVATILNHALAVAAGRLLTSVIPLEAISLIAALSFILFGLWTVRGDALEGEDKATSAYGPFLTVAIAFFIAELGDKTQLATISLAVKYTNPLAVLLGTTAGMIVADSAGILLGIVLGQRLPDALIRLVSAGVFICFGVAGAGSVLRGWLPLAPTAALLFALVVATLGAVHYLIIRRREAGGVHPAAAPDALWLTSRLSQALFLVLLGVGWLASLGLARPLAAIDHWITFVLLSGLGWKLIHGTVRPSRPAVHLNHRLFAAVVILAALTSTRAFLLSFPLALAIVPVVLLAAAAGVLLLGPVLARRSGKRLRRIAEHRVEIAAGLLLIGIALKTLIEHFA